MRLLTEVICGFLVVICISQGEASTLENNLKVCLRTASTVSGQISCLSKQKRVLENEAANLENSIKTLETQVEGFAQDCKTQTQLLEDQKQDLKNQIDAAAEAISDLQSKKDQLYIDNSTCGYNLQQLKYKFIIYDNILQTVIDECKNQTKDIDLVSLASGSGLYYFYYNENEQKSWFEANDLCHLHGMNLLRLDDAEKSMFVSDKMTQLNLPIGDVDFWISPNDVNAPGTFISSGWGTEATFLPWAPSEPNPSNGGHCVAVNNEPSGALVTFLHVCFDSKPGFVCEMAEPCASYLKKQ